MTPSETSHVADVKSQFRDILKNYIAAGDASKALYLGPYNMTCPSQGFWTVRFVCSVGGLKLTVKQVGMRGEGGGAYFDPSDTDALCRYVDARIDEVFRPIPVSHELFRARLEKQRSEVVWTNRNYVSVPSPFVDHVEEVYKDSDVVDL